MPGKAASRRPRWVRVAFAVVSAAIFVFAIRILVVQFRSLRLVSVIAATHRWGGRLPLAIALCAGSFLVVGLIEWRAVRWAKTPVSMRVALGVSFVANGIAHSLGATALVAGAVRARLYARHGIGLTTSATVTAFQTVTSCVGFGALAGVAALAGLGPEGSATPLVGGLMIAGVAAYVLACLLARGSLKAFGRAFELPGVKDALAQVALGALDNGLAMAALWVLLPPRAVSYPRLVGDYAVAYLGGAVSGVPGGVGPFEGVLAGLLTSVDKASLLAALLGFRLCFYVLPLILAGLLFTAELVRDARHPAPDDRQARHECNKPHGAALPRIGQACACEAESVACRESPPSPS